MIPRPSCFGRWRALYYGLQRSFSSPELESQIFIEEALERFERQCGSPSSSLAQPKERRDQISGGPAICGDGSYNLAVCPAKAGFEHVVRASGTQPDQVERS